MSLAIPILLSYLLGSINGSLVLGRLRGGVDIRKQGSGNAGGTNALRTQGPWFALGVVIIDVAKGWVAAGPLTTLAGTAVTPWLPATCALFAVLGHVYPVFHGFRGGKGAATLVGTILALSAPVLLALLGVWLAIVMLFGFVGLASILAAASLPLLFWWLGAEPLLPLLIFAAAAALLVLYTHRGNVARMRAGTEPRARRLWLVGRLAASRKGLGRPR